VSDVRAQAERLAERLQAALGDNLIGVYLHGSMALGAFNPQLSDLDVLAVARRRTSDDEKREVVGILAGASENPAPVEFHLLASGDLQPWRHPSPFDFHYGDIWRDALQDDLADALARQGDTDPDLAAHITVVRSCGVGLLGPPPEDVFPQVPWEDYADSLMRDLRWVRETERPAPVYRVLSPARVWATLATGEIHSKETGGAWALERIPVDLQPVLARALAQYRGETAGFDVDESTLERYIAYVETEARSLVAVDSR
jgi:predicted nucleotidyltransferase